MMVFFVLFIHNLVFEVEGPLPVDLATCTSAYEALMEANTIANITAVKRKPPLTADLRCVEAASPPSLGSRFDAVMPGRF